MDDGGPDASRQRLRFITFGIEGFVRMANRLAPDAIPARLAPKTIDLPINYSRSINDLRSPASSAARFAREEASAGRRALER